MRNISNKTIADAIAFVEITGSANGLHMNTRMSLYDYQREFELERWIKDGHRDRFTDEGRQLAIMSPLAKAHCWLIENGFKLDRWRHHRIRINFMTYNHPEDERTAWTGRHGRVYVTPSRASKSELVADFGPKRRGAK